MSQEFEGQFCDAEDVRRAHHAASVVRKACRENMEDVDGIPTLVQQYVSDRIGKPVTARDETALEKLTGIKWHLRRQYGMTHLETEAYYMDRSDGPRISFLIDWRETHVIWPTGIELENRNTHIYKGARERNAAREKLLEPNVFPDTVMEASLALIALAEALERMERASKSLPYGVMPDWYHVKRDVLPEAFKDGDRRALESILP